MEIASEKQLAPPSAHFDTPWKDVLDIYFQYFMEFCHPVVAREIDWSKGYESLDKELSSITKDSEIGKRIVDKLMKVWRAEGKETWVLLHTEVQGQPKPDFNERMYVYNYRLFDRFHKPIGSLAVLADDQPTWRPSFYENSLWGCQVRFDFISIKLLDYERRREELLISSNPFAIVILAHLAALKTKKDENRRFDAKLNLTRSLYSKGWNKDAILNLYSFIDWVMALSEPLELKYLNKIESFEQEINMTYITSAERIGIKKGVVEGERTVLLHQIQRKFGTVPSAYKERIEHATSVELLKWADAILSVSKLDEIFN